PIFLTASQRNVALRYCPNFLPYCFNHGLLHSIYSATGASASSTPVIERVRFSNLPFKALTPVCGRAEPTRPCRASRLALESIPMRRSRFSTSPATASPSRLNDQPSCGSPSGRLSPLRPTVLPVSQTCQVLP